MQLLNLRRALYYGSLVGLILLFVGLLVASVSAQPQPSLQMQGLPTRPASDSKPKPKPPSQPSGPGESTPEPTPTLPEPTPTPTPMPSADLTFEELGYDTFRLSESGSRWIDLYLPNNLALDNDESYLDLTIRHTPPLTDDLFAVRVTMNNAPLALITLSQQSAGQTTQRFYFKNAPLIRGHNKLHVAIDTGAMCDVTGAGVEVDIHGSSSFHLEYLRIGYPPDLALYPVPFFERSFEYEPVYVVLPDVPSAADLSAAATVAAGLGKFSKGEVRLVSILASQVSPDILYDHHMIAVGAKGSNQFLDQLDLPLSLDDPALSAEQGVIQELLSPWNPLRMILVVTGGSDEALSRASQALNRTGHLLSMQGSVAIVRAAVLSPNLVPGLQRDLGFTLADLGYQEDVVYGTWGHTLDYHFQMPPGWEVKEEPGFRLNFGHSIIASTVASSLDVYFNDVPIESVVLDEGNASGGTLELSLPFTLVRPGRNDLRISIQMNLPNADRCAYLDAKDLWTVIYRDSYFHLPIVPREVEPSLDLFPYPLNIQPSLSGVLLVLPDLPRQLDYDLMLDVAARLGAVDQGNFLALDVVTADLATQEVRQDRDLVLIGRPSIHSLIAELNEHLPLPFESGSDLVRSRTDSAVTVPDSLQSFGLVEELAAPWDPERTILVLTGTTDEGIALAGAALLSQGDGLAGNVALVEASSRVHAWDTRPLLATPADRASGAGLDDNLLIQLGDRWW